MGWRRLYGALRMVSLAVMFGVGACTSTPAPVQQRSHSFDKTEADLEYGRPQASVRYHQPRGVQHYTSDETDVDLVRVRTTQGEQKSDLSSPTTPPTTPSPTPVPGGGR